MDVPRHRHPRLGGYPDTVHVYAVSAAAGSSHDEIKEIEAREVAVPVTSFKLHNLTERDTTNCLKGYRVQRRRRGYDEFRIVDRARPPGRGRVVDPMSCEL